MHVDLIGAPGSLPDPATLSPRSHPKGTGTPWPSEKGPPEHSRNGGPVAMDRGTRHGSSRGHRQEGRGGDQDESVGRPTPPPPPAPDEPSAALGLSLDATPFSASSSITPSGPARPFRLARVPRPGMTNTNVRLGTYRPHSDVRSTDQAQSQHQSCPTAEDRLPERRSATDNRLTKLGGPFSRGHRGPFSSCHFQVTDAMVENPAPGDRLRERRTPNRWAAARLTGSTARTSAVAHGSRGRAGRRGVGGTPFEQRVQVGSWRAVFVPGLRLFAALDGGRARQTGSSAGRSRPGWRQRALHVFAVVTLVTWLAAHLWFD